VGLRAWILGPYVRDLERLSQETTELKAEVKILQDRLSRLENIESKVSLIEERLKILDLITDQTKENRLWIKELLKDIEDIKLEIEALKLKSEVDLSAKGKSDDYELEARVYELIRKGVTSPTKLSQTVGISKEKLYRILNRLMEVRLITTIGKGRRKKYIPRENAEEEKSG
jgi:hypothetical protein